MLRGLDIVGGGRGLLRVRRSGFQRETRTGLGGRALAGNRSLLVYCLDNGLLTEAGYGPP